jgi:hypothetical protein
MPYSFDWDDARRTRDGYGSMRWSSRCHHQRIGYGVDWNDASRAHRRFNRARRHNCDGVSDGDDWWVKKCQFLSLKYAYECNRSFHDEFSGEQNVCLVRQRRRNGEK